jgi:hypothetical protein
MGYRCSGEAENAAFAVKSGHSVGYGGAGTRANANQGSSPGTRWRAVRTYGNDSDAEYPADELQRYTSSRGELYAALSFSKGP